MERDREKRNIGEGQLRRDIFEVHFLVIVISCLFFRKNIKVI